MKTTIKFLTSVLIIFSLVLINTSCEGEDVRNGEVGPQGTDGQDGNANVITSDWFAPNLGAYTNSENSGDYIFVEHDRSVPEITQEIIDNGVVLVYGRLNTYDASIWPIDQIALMPITVLCQVDPEDRIDVWSANISVGTIKIRVRNNANNFGFFSNDFIPSSFRYILIPSSDMIGKSVIDFSNYEVVKKMYALED